ncbi:hypothetical protein PT502_03635 [Aliarcobacter butzleri]|uniref:hypothetical protein n=1 Tax=Aliarcobacter butzleri TaxID=28197 RepID=UPI001260CB9E|nr:hypothetical protein [Aliarcobacter butzleri]MCG3654654.1 hypothetical protein [Aliarcobacter butzleri]MCT7595606.1 hypothetical protein [Aliarcobacter butzleri]MDK2082886.1 hypothetical protein [Aliarcobacter butzleri]
MENNKSTKGILVSDTQLVDILDKYEFLMLHLNTQITPTINKMIQLQKEVQNLDVILNKTKGIETALIQANEKIENSTNQILNEKIDEAVKIKTDEKLKILDGIIEKQNQTIYKKQLFLISISCLVLGVLIGYFL